MDDAAGREARLNEVCAGLMEFYDGGDSSRKAALNEQRAGRVRTTPTLECCVCVYLCVEAFALNPCSFLKRRKRRRITEWRSRPSSWRDSIWWFENAPSQSATPAACARGARNCEETKKRSLFQRGVERLFGRGAPFLWFRDGFSSRVYDPRARFVRRERAEREASLGETQLLHELLLRVCARRGGPRRLRLGATRQSSSCLDEPFASHHFET